MSQTNLVKCAVPSCKTRLQRPSVFCRKHYAKLPIDMAALIDRLAAEAPTGDAMRMAVDAAVAEIHSQNFDQAETGKGGADAY